MSNEIIYRLRSYIFIASPLIFPSFQAGSVTPAVDAMTIFPHLARFFFSACRNDGCASGGHRRGRSDVREQRQGGVQHHPRTALLLCGAQDRLVQQVLNKSDGGFFNALIWPERCI